VATDCKATEEMLTEVGGEIERLDETARRHLENCAGCRETAAAEFALGRVFADALPPADPAIERVVTARLRPVQARRRVVAFLPVAASFLVAVLGATLVGGVPGGGAAAFLPRLSARSWMALVSAVSDWSVAVAAAARATAATLGPATLTVAGLLSFLGLMAVVVTAVRWRRAEPWHSDR